MVRNCYSSPFLVFVNFMASTLADADKTCLFKDFNDLRDSDSRELLAHTATSTEVKLTDSI